MPQLTGETIIVTGASRGMGASMAKRFVREGANVVLTARSETDLRAVADSVSEAPGRTLVVPADVTDMEGIESVVEETVDRFGGIDTLVNNAGTAVVSLYGSPHELVDVEEDDWSRILDVNLSGVYRFCKQTIPVIEETGGGNVINITSGLGRRGLAGVGPYVVSKWGLEGLIRTLALEVDESVNVTGLYPGGLVDTPFFDRVDDDLLDDLVDESLLPVDVMDDAAVLLAGQRPDGVSGESMAVPEWLDRLA